MFNHNVNSIVMNYAKIYLKLIAKRRQNPLSKNCNNKIHFHHIIPVSCGGTNTPRDQDNNRYGSNLIALTPKEHFLAHLLIWKLAENSKNNKIKLNAKMSI